jgi:aldose 1-epimerase
MEGMMLHRSMAAVCAALLAWACFAQAPAKKGQPHVKKQLYGKMPDGTPVDLYLLTNANGMEARLITYGGAVVSLTAPDRHGALADVVLGMDTLDGYRTQTAFFGALIGRYGNRIGGAKFTLEGKTYHLPANDGPNTLHGGPLGFDKRVWQAREVPSAEGPAVEFTYVSKDGEEGFPGTLTAKVVYTLTNKNELKIDYTATTDKPTVVNLTNHSYFNLKGAGEGDVLGHDVTIYASRFTPVDATLIPTGELRAVKGTPFDFTKSTAIGARIDSDDQQIKIAGGYDHNWVLDKAGAGLSKAAEVYEPKTGRVLEVWTTEPAMQFYTGNFLDGTIHGKGGKVYPRRGAFCMETQHYPDSPNHPAFPSTELKPGATYHTTTIYSFSAR